MGLGSAYFTLWVKEKFICPAKEKGATGKWIVRSNERKEPLTCTFGSLVVSSFSSSAVSGMQKVLIYK